MHKEMGQRKAKQVATYLDPVMAEKLQDWAEAENRTLSNLIATILGQYVNQRESEEN